MIRQSPAVRSSLEVTGVAHPFIRKSIKWARNPTHENQLVCALGDLVEACSRKIAP